MACRCSIFPFSACPLRAALFIGALLASVSWPYGGSYSDQQHEDPQRLMREVVMNELRAQQEDHGLWRHMEIRQRGPNREQLEFVETRYGEMHRLLAVNGHPLTPDELDKEDARIKVLLKRPQVFRQRARKAKKDEQEEQHFLKMLPAAFDYREVAREGNLIKLDFTPKPSFKPRRREGAVFQHMQGSIWIDSSQKRIAKMEGQLISDVEFGGGILGHLAKGGTFAFEQKDVGTGHWELTRLNVSMNGKALFFKTITVYRNETDSDFKPVPENTTLSQAAALLKQEADSLQEAQPAAKRDLSGEEYGQPREMTMEVRGHLTAPWYGIPFSLTTGIRDRQGWWCALDCPACS